MAQLLAPRSARIGVPNVTGYKRIVRHKLVPILGLMLKASPLAPVGQPSVAKRFVVVSRR
jgi:hypothetical protein